MIGNLPGCRVDSTVVPSSSACDIKCHIGATRAGSPSLPFRGSLLKNQAYATSQEGSHVHSDSSLSHSATACCLSAFFIRLSQDQQALKAPRTRRLVVKTHNAALAAPHLVASQPLMPSKNSFSYPWAHAREIVHCIHDRLWNTSLELSTSASEHM